MMSECLGSSQKAKMLLTEISESKVTICTIAFMTALATATPAFATINNTVTATGSSPGNTGDVTDTDTENVDVENAVPDMAVTKTADDTTDVAVGDTITYTYTVENTGNVTLTGVSLSESHEGTGTAPVPAGEILTTGTNSTDPGGADGIWDNLTPGEIVTWTGTYVVTLADLTGQADNDIDNTVTASATPAAGTLPGGPYTDTEAVDLEDQNGSLAITKVADDDTDVTVGQIITYTYTITNDGNVPVSDISLADVVNAGTGGNPTPTIGTLTNTSGNSGDDAADDTFDLLHPGDIVTYTGTYVVTQSDVDNLQ